MALAAVLGGLVGGLWLLLLWLAIAIWTYRDIRERTRDLLYQVVAVFLVLVFFPGFNIPGLLMYMILRPKETLDEAYSRALEEEALLREIGEDTACPSCRRFIEKDFLACPYCQAQLKESCAGCGRPLNFSWVACPYCGKVRTMLPPVGTGQPAAPPPLAQPTAPPTARPSQATENVPSFEQ